MSRRIRRWVLAVIVAGFVALNGLAIMHSRAMSHFSASGTRTPRGRDLTAAQKLGVVLFGVNLPRRVNEEDPSSRALPFTRETWKTRDGVTLEGWRVPADARRGTILLFHGYADRKASMLDEAKAFRSMGYECLLVDFRGAGGSDGNTTSIGYFEGEDVRASVAEAQRLGMARPYVVFGVSMGAAAALRAVGELQTAPDALILQYPFATLREALARRLASNGVPQVVVPFFVFWGGVQLGFDGFHHQPVEYAAHVNVPTLLMQGDRDDRVSMDEAQRIFAKLAGRKELDVYAGAGHVSLLKARPEQWTKAVSAFLATLDTHDAPAGH